MKKILKNKKGVTLLEGLIALMLLALVATGTFGVLLSGSRKATTPNLREEMILAVEAVTQKLNLYIYSGTKPDQLNNVMLCGDSDPLKLGKHQINSCLPPICDRNNGTSSFEYTIANSGTKPSDILKTADLERAGDQHLKVSFDIKCNGYSL